MNRFAKNLALVCTVIAPFLAGCGAQGAQDSSTDESLKGHHGSHGGGTTPTTSPAPTTTPDGGTTTVNASEYPLNGTYFQPVPPFFGCQAGDFTESHAPASFTVVSDATGVKVVYNGHTVESWAAGDNGTETGTYSDDNASFTVQQDGAGVADFVLIQLDGGIEQFFPNVASGCDWATQ